MKKLVAILMVILFLFNVGGYYLLLFSLTYQTKTCLVARFDNDDYSDDETVILKIPITLPYPIFENGFQRVNGEFQYNRKHYRLIKQKLENDTLYIVCYQDRKTAQILDAFHDFVKIANDLPLSSKNPMTFAGKMVNDYEPIQDIEIIRSMCLCINSIYAHYTFTYSSHNPPVFSPPPEGVS